MSMAFGTWERVVENANRLALRQHEVIPEGAEDSVLSRFEAQRDLRLPKDLRRWLRLMNGARVGPGGTLGVGTENKRSDIAFYFELFPTWQSKDWIPVATDGSGNYYVLSRRDAGVYFVEATLEPDEASYSAASNLPRFLDFLFERELGAEGWPFDRDYVLERDPEIESLAGAPLPWDA